jgi:hypothetical protein
MVLGFFMSPLQRETSATVTVSIGVIVMFAIEWFGNVKCLAIDVSLRISILDMWSVSHLQSCLNVSLEFLFMENADIIL